jgi:deoxyadenosine/deoxycytidine kinase
MHVAIAGNIGAGKTTLTTKLAAHYNWEAHFEDVDDNPYLNDFYTDMKRWSFNLQVYFLNSRFSQVRDIRLNNKNVIQDRSIYEDAYIFAPNLYEMNLMEQRDFNNYRSLFDLMTSLIEPPDLMIYLRASVPTLVKQIQKRGRGYEASISIDYLAKLNDKYNKWIENYTFGKLLVVEIDEVDFSSDNNDLSEIIRKVDLEIASLKKKKKK